MNKINSVTYFTNHSRQIIRRVRTEEPVQNVIPFAGESTKERIRFKSAKFLVILGKPKFPKVDHRGESPF